MSSFKNESTHIAVHWFTRKGYWNGPYFVSSVASYLFYIHWVTNCSTERPHKNLLFMSRVFTHVSEVAGLLGTLIYSQGNHFT